MKSNCCNANIKPNTYDGVTGVCENCHEHCDVEIIYVCANCGEEMKLEGHPDDIYYDYCEYCGSFGATEL